VLHADNCRPLALIASFPMLQTHVDNSFGNSLAFSMNNTFGTHVLLECCREYGHIKRFINVSTDEVYGEASLGLDSGLEEHSTLEPTNPYSAAKAGAEMMVKAYMTSYKLPCIITRGNNVYGPHQFPEKLIPKFTLLAMKGKELPIHGDGLSVRSYLFVEDVAEAFDVILHKGTIGETYNIGTKQERTVTSVATDIAKYVLPRALFARGVCCGPSGCLRCYQLTRSRMVWYSWLMDPATDPPTCCPLLCWSVNASAPGCMQAWPPSSPGSLLQRPVPRCAARVRAGPSA
jgi:nucleoside-diphosphate-sugar epimerase